GDWRLNPKTHKDDVVTDGLWIKTLGSTGFVGVVLLFTTVVLPTLRFGLLQPRESWAKPDLAPAAALTVVLALYAIDCLINAMISPIFMVVAGGLSSVASVRLDARQSNRNMPGFTKSLSRRLSAADVSQRTGRRPLSDIRSCRRGLLRRH